MDLFNFFLHTSR